MSRQAPTSGGPLMRPAVWLGMQRTLNLVFRGLERSVWLRTKFPCQQFTSPKSWDDSCLGRTCAAFPASVPSSAGTQCHLPHSPCGPCGSWGLPHEQDFYSEFREGQCLVEKSRCPQWPEVEKSPPASCPSLSRWWKLKLLCP